MFTLPTLPYQYNELEPFIDAKTVEIHYSKHHAGYVAKLNAALENHPDLLEMPLQQLLQSIHTLPQSIQTAVFNNGCQVYNHNIYWESIAPNCGGEPTGELAKKITETFGSFETFKKLFTEAGIGQFGSGWVWLSLNNNAELVIDKTSNADTPLVHEKTPLMTMDVWEHAYYLNYQNRRPDYIEAFWSIVNWSEVERKFLAAK